MADVTPVRQNIAFPGVEFLAACSEFFAQSLAGQSNFLNYFAYQEKAFFVNGSYSIVAPPQTGVDGLVVFEFDAQIIDVWMFNLTAGSAGSTEFDCLVATTSGGAFTSIFTTLPSISYLAGTNAWVGAPNPALIGSNYSPPAYAAPANTVAPVLNAAVTDTIALRSAMILKTTAVQTGGQNAGLLVHYRNR